MAGDAGRVALGLTDVGLESRAAALRAEGRTVSWLLRLDPQPHVLALLAFGDTVKPRAAALVQRLHAMGLRTVLLTGDNEGAAQAVG